MASPSTARSRRRWSGSRKGQTVRLTVDNRLDEDTSIHWHGLLVPFQMDGVPGVSFPGIRARSTFTYEFPSDPVGHLLVPQPLGAAGAARPLRADRHRSRGRRPDRVRPRACHRAQRLGVHAPPHDLRDDEEGGRGLQSPEVDPDRSGADGRRAKRRCSTACGWTRPTFRTSPRRSTPTSSTAIRRRRTGPACSSPASGCA